MQIETLRDVVNWSKEHHQNLALCAKHCSNEHLNERARMLLSYLAEHEQKLCSVLDLFETSENSHALNTWCYEYMDKEANVLHSHCNKPFADKSVLDIIGEIEKQNHKVIHLYRHLLSRAYVPSVIELLEQLVAFEEHEALRVAHAANRLEDI